MDSLLERFLRYVRVDTESDANSETCPSTAKQFDLANLLYNELLEMGLKKVSLDENGYLMATLPSNSTKKISPIGFIAHMDTSPDMSGKDVKPQIIEHYAGGDIVLNKEQNIVLSPLDFPELNKYIGQKLITTDGTTLLGADDKAGVAEIITAIEYLLNHPDIEHGDIRIGFTPDEEIGRGADKFDVKKFDAEFAFTLDGGEIGELEFENFNAAFAKLSFKGRNVHPGTAKNQMRNSMHIAMEMNKMLPQAERPEHTEKYEGFFHLVGMTGEVEESTLSYIIRDHDRRKFEQKKQLIQEITQFLNKKYGQNTVELQLKDQYYNMREKIEPVMHIIELAEKAFINAGVKPNIKAIRGGTDGARLSFMGLPTPNIFAGGHNFHGRFEFVPYESMKKAAEVIIEIVKLHAKS
jgi:tripeptide aminopeptidase